MKGQFFLDFLVHKERSSWLVYHDRYFLQWESHAPLRKISLGSCSHSASCWVRLDYIGQIESSQVPEVHQGTFVFLSRRMRILVGCAIFFLFFVCSLKCFNATFLHYKSNVTRIWALCVKTLQILHFICSFNAKSLNDFTRIFPSFNKSRHSWDFSMFLMADKSLLVSTSAHIPICLAMKKSNKQG